MSKPPEMPKLKALRPMAPDDPFYRRGHVVGVPVFGPRPSARGADSMRRSEKMSNAEISREEAIEIATRSRREYREDLPERCIRATGASDEPPEGLYRLWGDEPAWYVFFPPQSEGLVPSDMVVVSKRTGRVIRHGTSPGEV